MINDQLQSQAYLPNLSLITVFACVKKVLNKDNINKLNNKKF